MADLMADLVEATFESLAVQWESYRSNCLRNAGPEQIWWCRKSFYGGALSFYGCMLNPNAPQTHAALSARLTSLHAELEAFKDESLAEGAGIPI